MEKAIHKLLHGFGDFHAEYYGGDSRLFDKLSHGQHPRVLIIACSDSRVDPALITACDPGDMFVIRNVANLVPPYEPEDTTHHGVSAAIEYAIKGLNVEEIIILGHSHCGGIHALMTREQGVKSSEFIDTWLDLANEAREEVERLLPNEDEHLKHRACEEMSLVLGLENLMTFPWIAERVNSGELGLHAWYFHISSGDLYGYDAEQQEFLPIGKKTEE